MRTSFLFSAFSFLSLVVALGAGCGNGDDNVTSPPVADASSDATTHDGGSADTGTTADGGDSGATDGSLSADGTIPEGASEDGSADGAAAD